MGWIKVKQHNLNLAAISEWWVIGGQAVVTVYVRRSDGLTEYGFSDNDEEYIELFSALTALADDLIEFQWAAPDGRLRCLHISRRVGWR